MQLFGGGERFRWEDFARSAMAEAALVVKDSALRAMRLLSTKSARQYVCTYVSLPVCDHVCVCACTDICVCVHVCMHDKVYDPTLSCTVRWCGMT